MLGKKIGPFILFAFLVAHSQTSQAQDYPYDDVQLKRDENPVPREGQTENPVEDSYPGPRNLGTSRRRLPTLVRLALKVGGNFALAQVPDAASPANLNVQTTGFGLEGLFAVSWDLPYQPLFLEFESGYRSLFLTEDTKLHVIPVALGVFYRNRIGARSVWKPGIQASMDVRITHDGVTGETGFGVFPSVSFASFFETGAFLIEPMVTLYRIQQEYMFFVFALRTGFRF